MKLLLFLCDFDLQSFPKNDQIECNSLATKASLDIYFSFRVATLTQRGTAMGFQLIDGDTTATCTNLDIEDNVADSMNIATIGRYIPSDADETLDRALFIVL
jgi:hypothetical protein